MDPSRQQEIRQSSSAQTYKKQLPVAFANLKTLSDQGVPIVFGTDSGVPTQFMGYFEHLEIEMMAEAGIKIGLWANSHPLFLVASHSLSPC